MTDMENTDTVEQQTVEPDLVVPLTHRVPVAVHSTDWPVIAHTVAPDGRLRRPFFKPRSRAAWDVTVRRHADGRYLISGAHIGSDGRADRFGGYLINSDGIDRGMPWISRTLAEMIGMLVNDDIRVDNDHRAPREIEQQILAQLPPETI